MNQNLDDLLIYATNAAHKAGDFLLSSFRSSLNAREKTPGNWVSEADLESEYLIRKSLEAHGIPVHGEEEGGFNETYDEIRWLVDPLDGTTNFLRGHPAFAVSVGLVIENVPVVGVVYAPVLKETYSACTGAGATRTGEPLKVSKRSLANSVVGVGSSGCPGKVDEVVEDTRRVGSASLDLCWTAAGVYDGFLDVNLGPWDVAAGALIVREAGGIVTDWTGDKKRWLETGDIAASSFSIHKDLISLLGSRVSV